MCYKILKKFEVFYLPPAPCLTRREWREAPGAVELSGYAKSPRAVANSNATIYTNS